MTDERSVFEENPVKTAIAATVFSMAFWMLLVWLVWFFGPLPPNSKLVRLGITSTGGAAVFLFFVFAFVLAILWLTVSFSKRLTIVCDPVGFTVYSKSFWDQAESIRVFKWSDATGTYIKPGTKGSRSLVVMLTGEEMHLMSNTIFNSKEFSELESLFEKRIAEAHPRRV